MPAEAGIHHLHLPLIHQAKSALVEGGLFPGLLQRFDKDHGKFFPWDKIFFRHLETRRTDLPQSVKAQGDHLVGIFLLDGQLERPDRAGPIRPGGEYIIHLFTGE
jgi:hypothetical protein